MNLSRWFPSLSQEAHSILRHKHSEILGVGVLIGFLLLILNIFLSLNVFTNAFVDQLQTKLGMYFYVTDDVQDDEKVYSKVVDLTRRLESEGLDTVFASKQEAFGLLHDRVPGLVDSLSKFNIGNPLPATLYVMFDDQEEYDILKNTIVQYKDVIVNVDDVQEHATLRQQEQRVLQVLEFSRYVHVVGYIIAFILFITIACLGGFMLKNIFDHMHGKIMVKHLLGASREQITKPFMALTGVILVVGYVTALLALLVCAVISYIIVGKVLFQALLGYVGGAGWHLFVFIILQMVIYAALYVGLTHWYIGWLQKK